MKAFYDPEPNCLLCIDSGFEGIIPCGECKRIRRSKVEVISLGVGLFGDKAIIQKTNGQLETVPIKTLTLERRIANGN